MWWERNGSRAGKRMRGRAFDNSLEGGGGKESEQERGCVVGVRRAVEKGRGR